jgi:glycosyltransferase involved in cell wall biosynthesis
VPPLHVAQVNFFPAPEGMSLAQVMAQWPSLADIAEAAASAGTRISVIQLGGRAEQLHLRGVDYHMVDACKASVTHRASRIAALLRVLGANVVHAHSLAAAPDVHALSHQLSTVPMLLQDHADAVPRPWQRRRWRHWYAAARGVAFTAPELARPYARARLFAPGTHMFAIPESSTRFVPGDQAQAQRDTGLHGDPCVLWVGHLQTGKDPLTVLDGVAKAAETLPGLRLWCAFGTAPLLAQVSRRIQDDARLSGRVQLLGKVTHEQVQSLMRAADVFVSGSHAESCGYALLEAMACGAMPVVTDIPSFRTLTENLGVLWPPGDAQALAKALILVASQRPSRGEVRAHFDRHLSFDAIGRHWAAAYAQLHSDRVGEVA